MSETVFAADPTRLLIAALVRASVGAAVVAMTMAAGIMASMPAVAGLSPLYLVSGGNGLCNQRWCNGIQSCE